MADCWDASDNAALGKEIMMLPTGNFSGQRRYGQTETLLRSPMTYGASMLIMPIFADGGTHLFTHDNRPAGIIEAIQILRATTVYVSPTLLYM